MLLTIYNSKRDIYGNCYWACKLTHLGTDLSQGTLDANNVQTTRLRELGIEYTECELPIREFNRLTKGWQYLGCQWEMIAERLRLEKHVSEMHEKLASEALIRELDKMNDGVVALEIHKDDAVLGEVENKLPWKPSKLGRPVSEN